MNDQARPECPVEGAIELVGGKWRLLILRCLISDGPQRFNALDRALPGISHKVLTENLRDLDVEICEGDLLDIDSLRHAARDVDVIVHTAAQLGDWCSEEESRAVNVTGLENLVTAARENSRLRRFVHVSSLGVYEARDHFQTDETTPPDFNGIDAYTRTKAEAETVQRLAPASEA